MAILHQSVISNKDHSAQKQPKTEPFKVPNNVQATSDNKVKSQLLEKEEYKSLRNMQDLKMLEQHSRKYVKPDTPREIVLDSERDTLESQRYRGLPSQPS